MKESGRKRIPARPQVDYFGRPPPELLFEDEFDELELEFEEDDDPPPPELCELEPPPDDPEDPEDADELEPPELWELPDEPPEYPEELPPPE